MPGVALAPGTTIGRYEVRALLGSGGMGEVYKAYDPTLGRSVAIKLLLQSLSADAEGVTRFLQEARAASALNHPNILTIHEVGDHHQSRYIVAELVEGETLRQRMERGQLTLREILDVGIQAASALAAAHAAGIVHRDIKPDNLMLRPDGYVKVLDFGVAKLAQRSSDADPGATRAVDTSVGMVVGTIAYMAPEQARGLDVDGRADSFSLGIVLYELVTGRAPFTGPTASDTLVAILEREPPPLRLHARGLPAQIEWIIAKALDKDPGLRYQSIADLRVDLMRLKAAIESGRVSETAAAGAQDAPADQPIALELTDDSAQVQAVGALSRVSLALAVVSAAALIAAAAWYSQARPGADLPLQIPQGAVLTKARDAIISLGHSGWGSRQAVEFESGLNATHVAALAGLDQTREAIRSGAVAHWMVGLTHSREPRSIGTDPQEGDFAISLDPAGQISRFATGLSQTAVPPLEREPALKLGADVIRRALGLDVSAYDSEFIQRAFPAGTVELTWRNPARRFGHIEQVRLHLQGDRVMQLAHTFERPPGFAEPELTLVARTIKEIAPFAIGFAFVAPFGFGMYYLFKTKNWDALKQRLPIAICAVLTLSVAVAVLDEAAPQALLGVVFVVIFLVAAGLPAMSGILLWIRRHSPVRLWAAEQLTHGRVLSPAVPISLVDGVMVGAVIAALEVMADWIGVRIPGYLPNISREVGLVDQGVGGSFTEAITSATFMSLGIAVAVEMFDRLRVRPAVAVAILAALVGMLGLTQHQTLLAALPLVAAQATIAVLAVTLYRWRGFLAFWIAVAASQFLVDAMALRSLDDPDLVNRSNLLFMIVAVPLVVGAWGLFSAFLKRKPAVLGS